MLNQKQIALSGREAMENIRAVQALVKRDRRRGWAELNDVFRAGAPPDPPLDGRYTGELIALDIAPGVTQFAEWNAARWMPWKGNVKGRRSTAVYIARFRRR